MRATGIVRRIDDLGRIVIPKELRRNLRISEGDALEIFTGRDGEIMLKKYSYLGGAKELFEDFVETLSTTLNCGAIITDRDSIVAVANLPKKEFIERGISNDLAHIMENNIFVDSKDEQIVPMYRNDFTEYKDQLIKPLLDSHNEPVGTICLLSNEPEFFTEKDETALTVACSFLERQVNI